MLSSVTKFLNSLKEKGPRLFDQEANHDDIKITLAIFMNEIIHADKIVSPKEHKKALSFFQKEFDLDDEQTHELFDSLDMTYNEYCESLNVLKEALSNNQTVKMETIGHLNHLIICDGCKDSEYQVFEQIKADLL